MIKWIISDMDGTLLIDHNRLPDDFDEVMEMLKQKNIMFSPASGRQYQAKMAPMFANMAKNYSLIHFLRIMLNIFLKASLHYKMFL